MTKPLENLIVKEFREKFDKGDFWKDEELIPINGELMEQFILQSCQKVEEEVRRNIIKQIQNTKNDSIYRDGVEKEPEHSTVENFRHKILNKLTALSDKK